MDLKVSIVKIFEYFYGLDPAQTIASLFLFTLYTTYQFFNRVVK